MKYEHKAIIDRASKEGLSPCELASELLVHDLLNSALGQMRGHAVAFKNMSEQQQDAAIQEMQDEFKKAVDTAVRIIASRGTATVRMNLKKELDQLLHDGAKKGRAAIYAEGEEAASFTLPKGEHAAPAWANDFLPLRSTPLTAPAKRKAPGAPSPVRPGAATRAMAGLLKCRPVPT